MAVVAPAAGAGVEDVSSFTALAKSVNLADEVASSLWAHLELDPATDSEVAAAIPTAVLDESITAFVEEHPTFRWRRWPHRLDLHQAGEASCLFVLFSAC